MTPSRPPSLKLWRTILLSVPKNSSDDDFRFCRPNSLCLRQNSLFRRNNYPLGQLDAHIRVAALAGQ